MWGLFDRIINSYMKEEELIDAHMSTASVAIINFMHKAPAEYVSA
jgi:hypothetical protein